MTLKSMIKSAPLIGRIINRLRVPHMVNSSEYWERRYRDGGNSGAGSYDRLAEFKAEVLNKFVASNDVESVIEFGCGDGNQLRLAKYPKYIGTDVSWTVIEQCRKMFAGQPHSFFHASEVPDGVKADLALSIDVIYHLVEDDVFYNYLERLFDAAAKWVIIYASNKDYLQAEHVRHRKFTKWVLKRRPDFELLDVIPNRYPFDPTEPERTSFAEFFIYRRA